MPLRCAPAAAPATALFALFAPLTLAVLAVLAAPGTAAGQTTSLAPDEAVEFYPTEAVLDAERKVWIAPVHALVFEPERDPSARRALLGSLASVLNLPGDSPQSQTFAKRAGGFLLDNEEDQRLVVRLAGVAGKLEPSERSGHAYGTLEIPAPAAERAREDAHSDWLTVSLVLPANDTRCYEGRVRLLGPGGLSVISDIDDTLRLTEVAERKFVLARTYLEPFEVVPGMAALYASCAAEGASFHYISGSPWQLHAPLAEALDVAGFPSGPLALREFRWRDQKLVDWLGGADSHKQAAVVAIARRSPERRLILIGDSAGQDPEIYGRIARTWPDRLERILIRDVSGSQRDDSRYVAAFKNVPPERWTLYKGADELQALRAAPSPPADGPEGSSERHAVPPLR